MLRLSFTMRSGYDLSFTLKSQVQSLPKSRGLIFNCQFGMTLRASSEAAVALAHQDCPENLRNRSSYVLHLMGWDLDAGHLFPVVSEEQNRGSLLISTARMTAHPQGQLRVAELPSRSTMDSFRVGGSLSKSLA